jgi:hypothetical protein
MRFGINFVVVCGLNYRGFRDTSFVNADSRFHSYFIFYLSRGQEIERLFTIPTIKIK